MWLVLVVLLIAAVLSIPAVRRSMPFESLLGCGLMSIALVLLFETGLLR